MPGLILMGIACIIGAISGVFRRIPNQKIVTGEIVSVEQKKTLEEGEPAYSAYVEYDAGGMPCVIKSGFRSSSFRTGQKVRVAYNQKDPQQAVIRPDAATYVIMLGFVIAGAVVFCRAFFK